MAEINEKFVQNQVEQLKDKEDVEAVAVFGSYARDPEKEHNDLDFWIIVNGDWRKRETTKVDGIVVEKFFNPLEKSKEYLETDEWWKNYHWYKNADVRYDPDGLFEKLKEEAGERKEEYLDREVSEEEVLYYIWDMKQDLETDDVAQKRYMMQKLFDYLLDKKYQLDEQVPVKENYRVGRLKEFDGYMYKLAQDFLLSSSTSEKERKLDKMIDYLTRDLGDPNPEWETDKETLN